MHTIYAKGRAHVFALKLTISLALLIYLFYAVDPADLMKVFRQTEARMLLWTAGATFCSYGLSVYRLKVLLWVHRIAISLRKLFVINLIGKFSGLFTPNTFGQDLTFFYYLSRHSHMKSKSLASIMMDRYSGVVAAFTLGFVALILDPDVSHIVEARLLLTITMVGLYASLFFVVNRRLRERLRKGLDRIKVDFVRSRLGNLLDAGFAYGAHVKVIWIALLLSFGVRFFDVLIIYSLSLSLGWSVSLATFLVLVPVIHMISSVPISVNGIGVREGLYVLFFTQLGVASESAMALALLLLSWITAVGLAGGLAYLFKRD